MADTFKKLDEIVGKINPNSLANLRPPWKAGEVANPNGRPKGSRHRISEDFLRDFHNAWEQHGVEALNKVAEDKPHEFVRAAVSLLPKELHVKTDALEDMSEHDIADNLAAVRSVIAADIGEATKRRTRKAPEPEETEPTGRVN